MAGWFDRLRKRPRASHERQQLSFGDQDSVQLPASESPNAADCPTTFPRFRSTAGDQLAERHGTAGMHFRLRNAYTPSQPVTDRRRFAGRSHILSSLIRAIEDERLHAVVYGERGIGKTSSMHVVAQAARDARYIAPYVSCGPSSTFDETFRVIAAELPLLFHAQFGPTSAEAERNATFTDLLPETEISVRVASDLLARITGTRVVVFLDEFDRVEAVQFRRHIAEFIKNLSDRAVRVQFVIAGVADNLTDLIENIPSIQRAIFALEVPRMSESETTDLIRNGEAPSGLRFEAPAVRLITDIAQGLPYLASLLSHHAGLATIERGRTNVTGADVVEACREAVAEFRGRVSKRSQLKLVAVTRDYPNRRLAALAQAAPLHGGSFELADLVALAPSETVGSLKALLDELVETALLAETADDDFGRRFRFREESVQTYLWLLVALEQLKASRLAGARASAEVAEPVVAAT